METQAEFNDLAEQALPKLRNVVRKMVGHATQCEDIVQEALSKGWENYHTFKGQAQFSTWLCAIGVRCAQDFLRQQQRWRTKAQIIYADQCINNPEYGMEVGQSFNNPDIEFDVQEHIAYCFSCVGRSLEPMDQAALVLKEVLGLTNMEGAKTLGLSESVFRQHLGRARSEMKEKYEGLCALVNKEGVCYQCKGLREGFPPPRQGQWLDTADSGLDFDVRLKLVSHANIHNGKTQAMHEIFWKRTEELESKQIGDESVEPDCGKGTASE